ncbi:hypothetical protein [Enterococcus phage vB_EfaS_Ef5.2]|jgi:hypothetical protein|uniref:Uncharacterized protein n=1 Tax=Enterococcus phage vB_EFaS_TV51 TaxID=2759207 RepID=A0A7S6GHV7_9CAUD|nr:hypothetical protein [Haemophilus parainfluenzae]QBZ69927.1 hypothetical protein [Enterococcus phage vB_EfaS_Ef5.1]QBZ69995.1 hypothetical protein [Enterococcus phage vB_EfaS_Ef5.2]QBZ70283.1 hypothetical protein [Enterococcus phage vB_EfaS_Ef5.3]QNL31313.1 hypothetical protein TV51_54 [Enterococcus phage vB_EFaS_TV51]QNL31382.1 hypothetical protein TV54_55 [Enterococcus phage vB_EFaS_TV54]WNA13953.1 hypothetical protein [Enterococcus phage vB_Efa_VP16]
MYLELEQGEAIDLLDVFNAWIARYGYENMPESKRKVMQKVFDLSMEDEYPNNAFNLSAED